MPRKPKGKAKSKGNQKKPSNKKGPSPSKAKSTKATNDTNNNNNNNNNVNQTKESNPSITNETQTTTAAASNGTSSSSNGTATATNGTTSITKNTPSNNNNETKNNDNPDEKKNDLTDLLMRRNPRRWKVDKDKKHPFWDDQPVPTMKEKIKDDINESIENKTLDQVRKEPLKLPANYQWYNLDLTNDTELTEVYNLLYNHYVEDDDNMFRFNYSKEFLQWALLVPGYLKEWHLGVRTIPKPGSKNQRGKLCACITAIPALVNIKGKSVKMVEINFLCVYKTLRSKRLAPVLIKEITRRVNCRNIWQAVYTAGVVIPKPVASNRYWHRSLNPKKLIDIGFSCMRQRMTMPRLLRLYRVDKEPKIKNLRLMKEKDVIQCHKLLNDYLSKFSLHIEFSLDEVKHLLLPRDDVIYTYVVYEKQIEGDGAKGSDQKDEKQQETVTVTETEVEGSGDNGNNNNNNEEKAEEVEDVITDFFSYYNLSSTVINNPKYNNMKAGYSYYNVSTKTPLKDLISDALVLAKSQGFDVFNALDVMQNSSFLKDLKFGIGDGRLQYYMYNWRCSELEPSDVGIVLL